MNKSRNAVFYLLALTGLWSPCHAEIPHEGHEFDYLAFVSPGRSALCSALRDIPLGEDVGLIRSVADVEIQGVREPYHASMVAEGSGYLMLFRYDLDAPTESVSFRSSIPPSSKGAPFRTFIGLVRLDKNFKQVSQVKTLDTGSDFSEDPRLFRVGDDIFFSYTDLENHFIYIRGMRVARLDPQTLELDFVTNIDQQISFIDRTAHMDKNWVPFVRQEDGEEKIYFGYSINPHKVMKMKDLYSSELDHPLYDPRVSYQKIAWDEKALGTLRGSTPALLIDHQYVAFFHTLFYDEHQIAWYAMGAYTFEANPPFRVTSVSPYPILCKKSYSSFLDPMKRGCYPAGIVYEQRNGEEVFQVSCGIGGHKVAVVTFSKRNLLKSMKKVL